MTFRLEIRKIIKLVFYSLIVFFIACGFYFLVALIGSIIPVNSSFQESPQAILIIYLLSNGVHTDFVLPLRSPLKDWTVNIDIASITHQFEKVKFIAFGWGDRKFYLETPEWSDLTITNALHALFFPSQSAMHVTLMQDIWISELCVPIRVTEEQFTRLVYYIENSFERTTEDKFIRISNLRYSEFDAFYEATGSFHLFFTCNSWTNKGLQISGLRAAFWTPFDKGIFFHYR